MVAMTKLTSPPRRPRTSRPPRPVHTLTVIRKEQLAPSMVRIVLGGPAIDDIPDLEFTDHYVKLRFNAVTRTYTIRWLKRNTRELAIDFVTHGSAGVAGPWAQNAQPGDFLSFTGPGGKWAPDPKADHHVLVGDESALPAIATALEALPRDAKVQVFAEVANESERIDLAVTDATEVHWIHRDDHEMGYGEALTYAVQSAEWPAGHVEAFVHGNADMVKPLRHHLFNVLQVPRDRVSISGYWRTGFNEDGWQSSKHKFMAQVEAEQDRKRAS